MPRQQLTRAQWNALTKRIDAGLCVPLLGAAVNISRDEPRYLGLRLGREVAEYFARELESEGGPRARDLARMALEYEVQVDRPAMVEYLGEILPDYRRRPSPLLTAIANLPFRLVITTNYDTLLERALKRAKVRFETVVQPAEGFKENKRTTEYLDRLRHYEGLLLYKMHGTFKRQSSGDQRGHLDARSPVIVTEDDYIEFLTVVDSEAGRIGVPLAIKERLAPSSLLFLGYSLEDWDFRTLHRSLITKLPPSQHRRSFAIQRDPPAAWVDYWQQRKVTIIDQDVYEFAELLQEKYQESYSHRGERRGR